MYNVPDTDAVLRDGLRLVPVPSVSPDFDARVLAALHAPPTWWEVVCNTLRGDVRPLLTGAACGLPVTVLALLWTLHAPITYPVGATFPVGGVPQAATFPVGGVPQGGVGITLAPRILGTQGPSLDALLDKPNLTAADLRRWQWAQTDDSPPVLPPPPRRRACLPDAPTLAA